MRGKIRKKVGNRLICTTYLCICIYVYVCMYVLFFFIYFVIFAIHRYSLLGDKAERFSANPDTGEISTVVPLDREQTSIYHLTLVARDSSPTEPRASTVNLTILVKDVNDNAPRFSSPRYTAYVPGGTKPGMNYLLFIVFYLFSFSFFY